VISVQKGSIVFVILISKFKKIIKLNKNPIAPEQKEKKKLIPYQNLRLTIGRIKLLEMVIKSEANKEIKIAVTELKISVEIVCKSSFKK